MVGLLPQGNGRLFLQPLGRNSRLLPQPWGGGGQVYNELLQQEGNEFMLMGPVHQSSPWLSGRPFRSATSCTQAPHWSVLSGQPSFRWATMRYAMVTTDAGL